MPQRPVRSSLWLLTLLLSAAAPATQPADNPLRSVHTFMYQLQNLEDPKAVQALADSDYDLLILEPTHTVKGNESFDARAMLKKLRERHPHRLILAYLDIGQAESFRTYWRDDWIPPTKNSPRATPARKPFPSFLLAPDPDGWSDDFPVAFWDPQWQSLWLGKDSPLPRLMSEGFDGLYLDWVDAYDFPPAKRAARKAHLDPARAMVDFIAALRTTCRQSNPHALIVPQNALDLITEIPDYAKVIDAIGIEDTWFSGKGNAKWTSPHAGDIPHHPTPSLFKQYHQYTAAHLPVLTIDYCLNPQHAAQVYQDSRAQGFIPLVTRVSLDHLTATPPP